MKSAYIDMMPCPHCKHDGNPDVCEKCFYDSEFEQADEAEEES